MGRVKSYLIKLAVVIGITLVLALVVSFGLYQTTGQFSEQYEQAKDLLGIGPEWEEANVEFSQGVIDPYEKKFWVSVSVAEFKQAEAVKVVFPDGEQVILTPKDRSVTRAGFGKHQKVKVSSIRDGEKASTRGTRISFMERATVKSGFSLVQGVAVSFSQNCNTGGPNECEVSTILVKNDNNVPVKAHCPNGETAHLKQVGDGLTCPHAKKGKYLLVVAEVNGNRLVVDGFESGDRS